MRQSIWSIGKRGGGGGEGKKERNERLDLEGAGRTFEAGKRERRAIVVGEST